MWTQDLAAAGADAHVKNRKGETPIDIATELGNMAIVKQFEVIFNITGKKTREEMEEHFRESDAPEVGVVPQHLQQEFIKEAQKKKKESPAAAPPPRRTGPLNVSVKGGWTQGAPTVGIDEELARELAAMGMDLTAKSPREAPKSPREEAPPVVPSKPAQLSDSVEKKTAAAAAAAAAEKTETATEKTAAEEEEAKPAKRPSQKQAELLKLSAFAPSKKKREAAEEAAPSSLAASGGVSPRSLTSSGGASPRSLTSSGGASPRRPSPRRPSPRRPLSPRGPPAVPAKPSASPRAPPAVPAKPSVSPRIPAKVPVASPRQAPTMAAPAPPPAAATSPRTVAVAGEGEMPVEMAITDSLMRLYALEEQLTSLEQERNKQLLTQTIKQVRSLAINLKNFSALDECKSGENAENMAKLRDGIKAAVARIKGLS